MNRIYRASNAVWVIGVVAFCLPAGAYQAPAAAALRTSAATPMQASGLWQDRGNLETLNVAYGSGGQAHQPSGKFTFVLEDKDGTQPKFEVVDEQGVRWKAKLGEETKSEIAAARLLWAAGYYTDEDYYLSELRVEKLPKLRRGRQFVTAGDVVHGVRLERSVAGQKKTGNWSWSKNSLTGTKEMNGLRVMMALMNNWDLKTLNNAIYEEAGQESRYVVSDLGATFGKTGGIGKRTKSRLDHYSREKFIEDTDSEQVDLVLKSRPFFLMAIDYYHYNKMVSRSKIGNNIPRTHAKWMGQVLGRLSPEQIGDCFHAAGYSPAEVDGFSKAVQGRIADLNKL